jgi:uncharacterized protein YkwD
VKSIAWIIAVVLAPFAARAADLSEQILAEINLARTAPQQYAQIVSSQAPAPLNATSERAVTEAVRFLQKARPLPALTASAGMTSSAQSHVMDVGPTGKRGHRGSNGSQPWDRMSRYGKWFGRVGENIDYGMHDARLTVIRLIVDDGVSSRGHRKNIFNQDFHVAGAASGPHAAFGAMCVIDFATAFVEASGRVATRTTSRAPSL